MEEGANESPMKKTIFIIIGILAIIIIGGVWGYLFTYGTPKSADEVFARFGLSGGDTVSVTRTDDTVIDVTDQALDGTPQKLRQLSTRPVAGATFTKAGEVMYVEQGTGHVYSINLIDGKETLKSGTTIPQAIEALFSEDGTYVAITSYTAGGDQSVVYDLTMGQGSSTKGIELPLGATSIAFGKATGTLTYLLKGASGSVGYSHSIKKGVSTELFKIPLRDVEVLWGEPNFVYTTPTATQSGYLYKIKGNSLEYTTQGGQGLVGFSYGNGVVVTRMIDGNRSVIALPNSKEETLQSLPFIPEKCTPIQGEVGSAYCAVPTNMNTGIFPDDWYKGTLTYSDILWKMNIETGEATGVSDFLSESGREIDVARIGTTPDGERVWFINKNDNTLWMFDTTM